MISSDVKKCRRLENSSCYDYVKTYHDTKSQKTLSLMLCVLISYQPITFFINTFFNLFVGEGFIYDTLLCYVCVLVFMIKSIFIISGHVKKDVLGIVLFLLIAYLITYLFFPHNRFFMFTSPLDVMGNPLYILFVFSVSGYIFVRYITDYELLMKYLVNSSLVVVACSAMAFAIMLNSHQQPQYMVFSYNMLLQVVILIMTFIERHSISVLIMSMLGTFLILVAGARGPLVCLFATLFLYVLFRKTEKKKKIVSVLMLAIFIFIVLFFFRDVLMLIKNICDNLGINSRTLSLIIEGDFLNDSGRNIIQEKIIDSFSIFGCGLYGDRCIGGISGSYAHNFFVEMISQWGIIMGFILIVLVLVLIVCAIQSKNKKYRTIAIALLSTGFLKLFFSGSYLNQEPAFWMLLAFGVNSIYYKKIKKKDSNDI